MSDEDVLNDPFYIFWGISIHLPYQRHDGRWGYVTLIPKGKDSGKIFNSRKEAQDDALCHVIETAREVIRTGKDLKELW